MTHVTQPRPDKNNVVNTPEHTKTIKPQGSKLMPELATSRQQWPSCRGRAGSSPTRCHTTSQPSPIVVHHVEWCLLGKEQNGLELDLTLCVEVRVGERVQVVFGDALVEFVVLLFSHVLLC